MAKYRPVYTCIWKDPDFEELNDQEKLLFLYLITNESTTVSGVYPISYRTIGNECNIGFATVAETLENGCIKNVAYDKNNRVVFVKNFRKYNPGGKHELVEKGVLNDYNKTKHSYLWEIFKEEYPEFAHLIPTVAEPLPNRCGTIPFKGKGKVKGKVITEVAAGAAPENQNGEAEKLRNQIWECVTEFRKRGVSGSGRFVGKSLKQDKNEKAVLHTLRQCAKKQLKTVEEFFAYATAIMKEENGNYNERDFVAQAQAQKRALADYADGFKSPTVTK
jgi:hypothetical protein